MTDLAKRLIGFAYAGADLLIELNASGDIQFAMGASQALMDCPETELTGKSLISMIAPQDQFLVKAMLEDLQDGRRKGAIPVWLAQPEGRRVSLSLRQLATNGDTVSCAISPTSSPDGATPDSNLHSRDKFEDLASRLLDIASSTGEQLEMALVDIQGMKAATASMSALEQQQLEDRLAGVLRAESRSGSMAARISGSRFAIVRSAQNRSADLGGRLVRTAESVGVKGLQAVVQSLPVDIHGDSGRLSRAVRYALEEFNRDGLTSDQSVSLSETLNLAVRRTLERAGELGRVITEQRFHMAYQPVVSMADGRTHHYEALIRFDSGKSPVELIQMAEEFDLIEELDTAVMAKVVERLVKDSSNTLRLAANVSGRTITSEAFVERATELLAANPSTRGRLIFEVTETATIQDLARADRLISRLRDLGCEVCLDDFGAGAASLAYLQRLTVDIVKIDGRYIRELLGNDRDTALVRHIVKLCKDLKVRTVAEMVEGPEVEAVLKRIGVDYGQGWLYGRASDNPIPFTRRDPAKRAGTQEAWG
jgi:EAL domain-containing protein (putative c-di-GMP-specific phosphodiesterase class I)